MLGGLNHSELQSEPDIDVKGGRVAESREQKMIEILRDLRADSLGIEAAILISSDAMPLASDGEEVIEEEVLSALASALISASEKVARDLSRGNVEHLYLRGDKGDLVAVKVNEDALLACMVNHDAKMGLTLLEVRRCAGRITEII